MANTTLTPGVARLALTGKERGPGWGAIGWDHLAGQRAGVPVLHWYPVSGIRVIPGKDTIDMTPLFNRVQTPIAVAGTYALECYTSGTFFFDTPVDAGLTYTCSAWFRKSLGYQEQIQGFRLTPRNLLPYLEITRSDGAVFTAAMADVDDVYQQTLVVVPVTERGVLNGKAVIPGLPGTTGFFYANKADLVNRFITKVWMNYYDVTAAQT